MTDIYVSLAPKFSRNISYKLLKVIIATKSLIFSSFVSYCLKKIKLAIYAYKSLTVRSSTSFTLELLSHFTFSQLL